MIKKYIMMGMVALLSVFALTGCKVDATAMLVTQKAYDLTCSFENYVVSSDVSNIVDKVQSLKIPLNSVANGLEFIVPFINEANIIVAIKDVVEGIRYVISQADVVNQENGQAWKDTAIDKIRDAKSILFSIGKYVGLNLECKMAKGEVGMDQLLVDSGELNSLVKSTR